MRSTLNYLYSLQLFGMKFGLRNIRALLRSVGQPQNTFKSIHIAGTNGKGSTAAMVAAIFTAAGYRVGLYTSPHLVKFNERIRINGKMISDRDIVRITRRLRSMIDSLHATFFDATTAMAFIYFAEQKVDISVIETGLGGRLDSTNVIRPIVSIITSIGKDHTAQLGKTYSSIAREKAGIIKTRIPLVMGNISGIAKNEILSIAKQKHSPVLFSKRIAFDKNIIVQLKGDFQTENAQCAVAAIAVASKFFLIGNTAIQHGLENTSELTGLRARMETIFGKPTIILDVAHNPAGIRRLVMELKKHQVKKPVIVFAIMQDKDYLSMLTSLKELQPTIICTQLKIERALDSSTLYTQCSDLGISALHAKTTIKAIRISKKIAGKKGIVLITGSHYLVGEAIGLLK